jgi:hypothetical protein
VKFQLPAGFPTGRYKLHATHKGQEIAIPTVMAISDLPEMTVSEPPVHMKAALAIKPSTVLNGLSLRRGSRII